MCSIDFASDDKFIASGSFDGALQVFHLEKDADDKLAKVKSLHHLKALHSCKFFFYKSLFVNLLKYF